MCNHDLVKCLKCGLEGTPAGLMGSKKKTMSEAAMLQRKIAGAGGRPKGSKNKPKTEA